MFTIAAMNTQASHMSALIREYQEKSGISNRKLADACDVTEGAIRALLLGKQSQGRAYRGRNARRTGEVPLIFRIKKALHIPETLFHEALLADTNDEARAFLRQVSNRRLTHTKPHQGIPKRTQPRPRINVPVKRAS